jgi:hypothetical protein
MTPHIYIDNNFKKSHYLLTSDTVHGAYFSLFSNNKLKTKLKVDDFSSLKDLKSVNQIYSSTSNISTYNSPHCIGNNLKKSHYLFIGNIVYETHFSFAFKLSVATIFSPHNSIIDIKKCVVLHNKSNLIQLNMKKLFTFNFILTFQLKTTKSVSHVQCHS